MVGGNVGYVSEHILFSSFSIDKAPTTHCIIHLSIHQTSSEYIIFEFLCWDCKDQKKKKKKSGVRNFPHEKSEYWYRKCNYKNRMRTSNKHVVLKLQNDLTVAQIRTQRRADHSLNISQMNKHIMTLFWDVSQCIRH